MEVGRRVLISQRISLSPFAVEFVFVCTCVCVASRRVRLLHARLCRFG